jgi:hypothetical protein
VKLPSCECFSEDLCFVSTYSDGFRILVGAYNDTYAMHVLEMRTISGIAASRAHPLTAYSGGKSISSSRLWRALPICGGMSASV